MSEQGNALIFAAKSGSIPDDELKERLSKQFDHFDLVLMQATEHTLYFEANQIIRLARTHEGPVFLVVDEKQPLFSAIVAAKLSRIVETFMVMNWIGERFRVLKVP